MTTHTAGDPPPPTGAGPGTEGAGDATSPGDRRAHRPVSRTVPALVLVASVTAAFATWGLTASVVRDQEHRLLDQRADEVKALLLNAFVGTESSLQVLANLGTSPDPASAPLFAESAQPLVKLATVAVGAAVQTGGGFVVTGGAGDVPAPGQALDAERSALFTRALTATGPVATTVPAPRGKRLVLAAPATSGRGVAFQETILDPGTPVPSTPDSPFRELRVALYLGDEPDPEQLLLTTEAEVPLSGRVVEVPFEVGSDRWTLAVSARQHLTGSFAADAPKLLLGAGLVLAAVATAVAHLLVRRRQFALSLVARRTSELQATLAELAGTRAALDRMLTAGPMLVIRADPTHEGATYVSPNIERLCGLAPADTAAPDFLAERVHPDDLAAFRAVLERIASGSSAQETLEYRFRHGDGTHRWTAGVFVADDGSPDRTDAARPVLVYALDVHDRRAADEARREAQEAAESANIAKSQFLSRMSHELRTPLNAVLGFGQLLELQTLTEDQAEYVDYIVKGGRHLLDLINEVLDISRIEAGELALSPEPVLASGLIGEAVDLIRPLADQRGIQVVVDRSGPPDAYVFADRQRAKQILLNLLSNAVKYNRTRGTVAVSCTLVSATRLGILVTDTGPGIAAEQLGRLFTAFERLGAEHTDVEGTGIGLALSKRLAEAMDGQLSATSVLGRGSTFVVELPRVEGQVERYERLNGAGDEPAPAPADSRRTVLHIEDNLANLNLMERILARRSDIQVVAAMQGSLGLELAREHRPAMILLDLHLPDMSGEQVLQRLRDDPVTSSIPVVMVSADATTGQIQRLLSAGAAAYVTKPIDVPAMLRALDEVLSN
ncbi:MAG: ATP-binding response regulator [Actinomycetota bacterium]